MNPVIEIGVKIGVFLIAVFYFNYAIVNSVIDIFYGIPTAIKLKKHGILEENIPYLYHLIVVIIRCIIGIGFFIVLALLEPTTLRYGYLGLLIGLLLVPLSGIHLNTQSNLNDFIKRHGKHLTYSNLEEISKVLGTKGK